MVATLTLTELEINQVQAALTTRLSQMSRQLCTLKEQRDSPDNAFAIACTEAAIRDSMRAQLAIAEATGYDYPPDATVTGWTQGELAEAYGR